LDQVDDGKREKKGSESSHLLYPPGGKKRGKGFADGASLLIIAESMAEGKGRDLKPHVRASW